ncbi:MAG: metallophosphoesterase [Pseudomonadota bacterium]
MQTQQATYGRVTWLPLIALLLGGVAACGGAGTDDGAAVDTPPVADLPDSQPPVADCSDCGEVVIGLTDADGDFLSYSVDVQAISLTRLGGAVVDVLPRSARVDFAEYTELAEFFTAAIVPNGVYVSGSITLDYSDAEVFVEVDGEPVAATLTDTAGAPLGVQQVTIELAEREQLVVRRGAPALLVVDFDLNASHTVDVEADPVVAVAEPFLLAEVNPTDVRSLRVRGPLVAVDTEALSYDIAVRPFQLLSGDFGAATVFLDDDAFVEIDGTVFKAADGIRALAEKPIATATLALSEYDVASRRLDALEVYAGSSVPGGELDVAQGTVVARDGDTLTLRGARLIRDEASIEFLDALTVELGAATRVSKARFTDFDGGTEAISVGQRVDVLGDALAAATVDGTPVIDATDGFVRLRVTTLSGTVTQINGRSVALDLQSLSGLPADRLDFAGTGSDGNDADPQSYELGTGALPLERLNLSAPLRAAGFVSPFGVAPPDFEVTTLVDFSDSRARLDIDWQPDGSTAPFVAVNESGIVFDLNSDEIGRREHLRRGAVRVELSALEPAPVLTGATDRTAVYALRDGRTVRLYNDFAEFTEALAERLDGATPVRGLHALGGYDDASGEFVAHRIAVRLR